MTDTHAPKFDTTQYELLYHKAYTRVIGHIAAHLLKDGTKEDVEQGNAVSFWSVGNNGYAQMSFSIPTKKLLVEGHNLATLEEEIAFQMFRDCDKVTLLLAPAERKTSVMKAIFTVNFGDNAMTCEEYLKSKR